MAVKLEEKYIRPGFESLVTACMREFHVPGVALSIIQGDDICSKGYGVTEHNGSPVTSETLFDTASMSKSFTAAAVALLIDQKHKYGDIDWEVPVSHLLPRDFVLPTAELTSSVTITDILSHQTGLLDRHANQPDTPRSIVRKLRHIAPTKPLRTCFQYNNFMYTAASCLIDELTDDTFANFIKKQFWTPLGMSNTFYGRGELESYDQDRLARPTYWNNETQMSETMPYTWGPDGQGAGEIVSSASDWAKWVQSWIKGTTGISQTSYERLLHPYISCNETLGDQSELFVQPLWYAMGWQLSYYHNYKLYNHEGGIPGMSCMMCFVPALEFGFVVLGNSEGMDDASTIIGKALLDLRLGLTTDAPPLNKLDKADDEQEKERKAFPNRPAVPLPLTLPLDKYLGEYYHPAYETFTLERYGTNLKASGMDRTYSFMFYFEHVSGEYFLLKQETVPDGHVSEYESRFVIDVAGQVSEMWLGLMADYDGADWVKFQHRIACE